ncbi:MAG: hypothetical protein V1851_00735 [Patescibacteria group bacterium]
MKKFKFSEIFRENSDGSLEPIRHISVNKISFGPGVMFQKGVVLGGINFHLYKNWDIAAEEKEDGSLEIMGFYEL